MTDHCYWLSALNQNIGYNQPTNTGYYIGSDVKSDADAWAEAAQVQNRSVSTGIHLIPSSKRYDGSLYDLSGRKIADGQSSHQLPKGIYIKDGKKVIYK